MAQDKDKRINQDDIATMGLKVAGQLVELGYIRDCTDTDWEDEFEVQDTVREVITDYLRNTKGYTGLEWD